MEDNQKELWGVWSYSKGIIAITECDKAQKIYDNIESEFDWEDVEDIGPQIILFKVTEQMTVIEHEATEEEPWEMELEYYKNEKVKEDKE